MNNRDPAQGQPQAQPQGGNTAPGSPSPTNQPQGTLGAGTPTGNQVQGQGFNEAQGNLNMKQLGLNSLTLSKSKARESSEKDLRKAA